MEPEYFQTMNFRPDSKTFVLFRQYLDSKYTWAWYIWDKNSIPNSNFDNQDIKPQKQVRTTRQEQFKDVIFQKWRSKFNNKNLFSTPASLEKRRMARKKPCTSRRRLQVSRNTSGDTESQYGTLVGTEKWDAVSKMCQREYEILRKHMLAHTSGASPALAKELIRLWEAVYAKVNLISQADLTEYNKTGHLVVLQHYLYYEGYAKTICQLNNNCAKSLSTTLYSLAEAFPKIFRPQKFSFKLFSKEDYSNMPLITTLLEISSFFGESIEFHVALDSHVNTTEQITNAVSKNPLCNVIVNYSYFNPGNDKRFGVAVQGVPFIRNLTEEEASNSNELMHNWLIIYYYFFVLFTFATLVRVFFVYKTDRGVWLFS